MGGGLDLIRVADDGAGLARDDPAAGLRPPRHQQDRRPRRPGAHHDPRLPRRALASIAAVSSVTLVSRPAEAEIGAQISVRRGRRLGGHGDRRRARNERRACAASSLAPRAAKVPQDARDRDWTLYATGRAVCAGVSRDTFVVTSEGRQALLTAGDGKLRNVIAAGLRAERRRADDAAGRVGRR